MKRQEIIDGLHIQPDDLVLEVGSGDNPMARSNILSDICEGHTPDREGRAIYKDNRPFIACDGHQLPFADKSIDYIIARQVLEYVDEPGPFLDELTRVGKRGYIEVANGLREVLFDWDARKYVVRVEHGGLLIRRKEGKGPFHNLFRNLKDPYLEAFMMANWDLFNYCFEWDGEINYNVDETGVDSVTLSKELDMDFTDFIDTSDDRIMRLLSAVYAFYPPWLRNLSNRMIGK